MDNFTNNTLDISTLPRFEEVDFNPVSKKYLLKTNLQTTIFMLFVLAGYAASYFYNFEPFVLIVFAILIPLFFAFRFWNNYKLQQSYGYALREKDILFRRGFFVNSVTVLPFNRIQHASISRDVMDKFLGISSLQVFTAGGSGSDISIPGLQPEQAQQLKEVLAGKISEDEL